MPKIDAMSPMYIKKIIASFLSILTSPFVAVLILGLVPFGNANAQGLSAENIIAICSAGSQSLEDNDANFSIDENGLRVRKSQGELSIFKGGDLLLQIEDFTYADYVTCVGNLTVAGLASKEKTSAPSFDLFLGCSPEGFWRNEELSRLFEFGEKNPGEVVKINAELRVCDCPDTYSDSVESVWLRPGSVGYHRDLYGAGKISYCLVSRMFDNAETAGTADFCLPSPSQIPLKAGYWSRERACDHYIRGEFAIDAFFVHGAVHAAIYVPDS